METAMITRLLVLAAECFQLECFAVILISPFVCGAEARPRLCDPPCSEEQAGIGPISQKPELLTLNDE
jgi:hypothetical protein